MYPFIYFFIAGPAVNMGQLLAKQRPCMHALATTEPGPQGFAALHHT
jgi:hypothetical protein